MAEKRMITRSLYYQMQFLNLSPSQRDLYNYLLLNADNDGVVEAFGVLKILGASPNDLQALATNNFIYPIYADKYVVYLPDFKKTQKLDGRGAQPSNYRSKLLELYPNEPVLPLKDRKGRLLTDERGCTVGAQWAPDGCPLGEE